MEFRQVGGCVSRGCRFLHLNLALRGKILHRLGAFQRVAGHDQRALEAVLDAAFAGHSANCAFSTARGNFPDAALRHLGGQGAQRDAQQVSGFLTVPARDIQHSEDQLVLAAIHRCLQIQPFLRRFELLGRRIARNRRRCFRIDVGLGDSLFMWTCE